MAITLEQVERLREKANISYEQARQVLEQTGGDLLEALILLERQGVLRSGSEGAYFTTRPGGEGAQASAPPPSKGSGKRRSLPPAAPEGSGQKKERDHSRFRDQVQELLAAALDLLRHATVNQFQVWRRGEIMTSMPVLILILLIVVAFWVSVPLLVLGLMCGCKYTFAGPDLDDNQVGETVNRAAQTIGSVVDQVKDEFTRVFREHEDKKEK